METASLLTSANVTELGLVLLYVNDVPRSRHFYEELLGLKVVYENEGRIQLKAGHVNIMLHPALGRTISSGSMALYLSVDDVDGAIEILRNNGVQILQEPVDEPWGARDAEVLDPDGYDIYLTQRLGKLSL